MSTIQVDSEDLRRVMRHLLTFRNGSPSEPPPIVVTSVMRLCSALPQSRHLVKSYKPQEGVNVKIAAIKAVVHHMGLGLKEARTWIEHLPKETDNADLARALEAVGCVVEQLGGSTPGAVVV